VPVTIVSMLVAVTVVAAGLLIVGFGREGYRSLLLGGLLTGVGPGSATVTATSEGKSGSSAITVQAPPATHAGYYVTPSGSASGTGSTTQPWNLATALAQPSVLRPGDTIWVRGGTYTGSFTSLLRGTAAAPIIVRGYPGERATIDGQIRTSGAYAWFWGLEVMKSNPVGVGPTWMGVDNRAPGTRLINLVVHDASASGIGDWMEAPNSEVYGCLLYNNGLSNNLDHGIYVENQTGSKRLADNIIFTNLAYGIHQYASTGQAIDSIHIEGNILFNSSTISSTSWRDADILVGGSVPVRGSIVTQNYSYRSDQQMTADVGYHVSVNQDLTLTDNYFVGALSVLNWTTATVTGNTVYNFTGNMVANSGNLAGTAWSGNTFFGNAAAATWNYAATQTTFSGWKTLTGIINPGLYAASVPAGIKVVVRPNQYEPGRANIAVYNWALQSTVSVDVSGVLQPGDRYVVQNVQAFYGSPAAAGTYDGSPLQLPMAALTPPAPIGRTTVPAPVTGPLFNAFVLLKTP